MSHEIRTPMNGVLGMIEVLERQNINDVHRRTVSIMRDSAQALLHIIDDVLDFSKIESGRLELELTTFSLTELIEGALDTVRHPAHRYVHEPRLDLKAPARDHLPAGYHVHYWQQETICELLTRGDRGSAG
jgi:signal transduction histidine kinase